MTTKLERGFNNAVSRYDFDNMLKATDGWAQFDTGQDAPYFGIWVNPIKREIITFCEGDTTHTTCSTSKDFADQLREMIDFYRPDHGPAKIDCCLNRPAYNTIRAELTRLGFADDCH